MGRLLSMDPMLLTALEPVLLDVERSALPVSFEARDYEQSDWVDTSEPRICASAILWASDGAGTGIQVDLLAGDADRVAALANVVQDLVIEDNLHRVWPRCPLHPNGGHPLVATARDGRAVWECPSDATTITQIGTLPA